MNRSMLMMTALLATLSLGACEKPTVINVPAPEAVPGPAGATGATGATGEKGTTGTSSESSTVIVMPPAASEPAR